MPIESAAIDLLNGDTAPPAPDAGFASFFFRDGIPMMRRPGQAPLDLRPRWPITFVFAGEVETDVIFGHHTTTEPVILTRLELCAQEVPAAALTITLVGATGVSLGRTITLAAGTPYVGVDIADLALAAGSVIRAKITGSVEGGAWLTLRLFLTPQ